MFIKNKAKKILHVITDTNIGGAGVLLLNLIDNYNKEDFEMAVLLPNDSLLKNELDARGCAYREVSGIAEKSFSLGSVGLFLSIFRETKPDIVHTHASMSARIAARIYGKCGLIYTRHCAYELPAYKKRLPYKGLNGVINNYFADKIISISPAAKENLVDTGVSPKKIEVMFNGVDSVKVLSEDEKSQVRERLGLSRHDFVCAIIARLVNVKGHEYVLEACKMLEAADPCIKIIIAGAGPEEESLKKLAANLNLKNCIFTGFVKNVYEIENIMDLQLNASYGTETSSLSLLEGMSLGVPAVASDFGGNPYLIRNNVNGLIVPKKNAEKICEAVLKLKNNTELYKKLSENSIMVFNQNYTSRIMAANVERVYKEFK